jgi:hypothetical protein
MDPKQEMKAVLDLVAFLEGVASYSNAGTPVALEVSKHEPDI